MSLQTSGHKNARWGGYPRTGRVRESGAVRYYLLAHYPGVIGATPRLENLEEEEYSLVLTNPPFKGSLAFDEVAPNLLKTVKTKKTELLFLALFLRILKTGGRCAVIIPDGVLFGSSKAHVGIRKEIIENHHLHAVISMPSLVSGIHEG